MTDILTLAEGKLFLSIADLDTSDDTRLASAITAITAAIDKVSAFGPVVARDVTDEDIRTVNIAGKRVMSVRTMFYPVYSWTSVTEYVDTVPTVLTRQSLTSQPDDGYYAYPGRLPNTWSGLITRTMGSLNTFWEGDARVSYSAGRFADTASVPDQWKEMAGLVLQQFWRVTEPASEPLGDYEVPRTSFPKFDIPNAAKVMLWNDWQGEPD